MRVRVFVLFILLLFIMQGCGGTTSSPNTVPSSLDVTSMQVLILPSVTKIPVNQTIHTTIKLTAASGSNQALEYSLKGASNSYPPQTRGKDLSDAFPGCAVSANIFVDTNTPGIDLVSPATRSLNDTEADWNVDITPQSTGSLSLSGEIDVQWSLALIMAARLSFDCHTFSRRSQFMIFTWYILSLATFSTTQ